MAEDTAGDPERELDQAREALDDAQVLLDGDGSDAGVLNRLYYAAFHAAQAALYDRGRNPSSHGHVRQQFGQYVVLAGDATREEGRLLGRCTTTDRKPTTVSKHLNWTSTNSVPTSLRS